jgi:hypothetical protein
MIIAKMLDARPTIFNENTNVYQKAAQKSKYGPTTNWLSDTQLEQLSSGYHYLNCMLSLLKRKQELKKLVENYHSQEGKALYPQLQSDLKELLLLEKTKMIGKEYNLGKNTNPLLEQNSQGMGTGLGLSTA